jgi:hypothetical protein
VEIQHCNMLQNSTQRIKQFTHINNCSLQHFYSQRCNVENYDVEIFVAGPTTRLVNPSFKACLFIYNAKAFIFIFQIKPCCTLNVLVQQKLSKSTRYDVHRFSKKLHILIYCHFWDGNLITQLRWLLLLHFECNTLNPVVRSEFNCLHRIKFSVEI